MEPESISLTTICDGGVPEVFERELREVIANITDPNTDPEATRSLTIKFVFKPYEDRSGAHVAFTCKPALQPVQMRKSQMFLSRHTGQLKAYAQDQRQVTLFGKTEENPLKSIK
jgi:hypothetical protein